MRAVFERPNSTFLDSSFRYNGSDPVKRLKMLKQVEFAFLLTVEEVMCWVKSLLLVLLVLAGLWLGVRYGVVAFPILGIHK